MGAYIAPLRVRAFTRYYDAVIRASTREQAWRGEVARCLARETPRGRVLDLGCGTGSLLHALRSTGLHRSVELVGCDLDVDALGIATGKLAGDAVALVRADARRLPFGNAEFDTAVSCLFFHHLDGEAKCGVLAELHRVLRPGGRLIVSGWGKPLGPGTWAGFQLVRLLDGFAVTRESARGTLPPMIADACFSDVSEVAATLTPLGVVRTWSAMRRA